jgi:RNA polymerase sigma factor (TIGR02999 family)
MRGCPDRPVIDGRAGRAAEFTLPGGPGRVHSNGMSDVTRLLDAAAAGNHRAAADLLPLVYDELRTLAAARMAAENPGNTLDATALVHEAYVRLVGMTDDKRWHGRGHFFTAAAEAMRRVLVDRARGKARSKRGGGRRRVGLSEIPGRADHDPDLLLTLDDAMTRLATEDAPAADVAKLHLFAGLTVEEAGTALGVSRATAYRNWSYGRAWLQDALGENP